MAEKVLRTGDLAYVDTLGPLLPCKVESITGQGGQPSTAQRITVSLTADRPGYRKGERLEWSGTSVVPRSSVYTRSGQYWIRIDWTVEADSNA